MNNAKQMKITIEAVFEEGEEGVGIYINGSPPKGKQGIQVLARIVNSVWEMADPVGVHCYKVAAMIHDEWCMDYRNCARCGCADILTEDFGVCERCGSEDILEA